MKRRRFLGWAIASFGGAVGASASSLPKKENQSPKVLKVKRCPKCKCYMYLPVETKAPKSKFYSRALPIECKCHDCGYTITANVACHVSPRMGHYGEMTDD